MKIVPVMISAKATTGTMVNDEDYQELSQHIWRLDPKGYVYRWAYLGQKLDPRPDAPRRSRSHNQRLSMHRFLMGVDDPRVKVDHRNRNPLDNRRENLRIATDPQNKFNSGGRRQRVSRFKGVSRADNKTNPWVARITLSGKNFSLGCFPTEEDAARAYNAAARELHGDFAYLNEVPE